MLPPTAIGEIGELTFAKLSVQELVRDTLDPGMTASGGCVFCSDALKQEKYTADVTWKAKEYSEILTISKTVYLQVRHDPPHRIACASCTQAVDKYYTVLYPQGATVVKYLSSLPLFANVPLSDVVRTAKVASFLSASSGTIIAQQVLTGRRGWGAEVTPGQGEKALGCWIVVSGDAVVLREEQMHQVRE